MAEAGIAAYYDRLTRWNTLARVIGYGGGRRTLTVHRPLADPRYGGRPTATRLHDLLDEALGPFRIARALDAGCGLGGTMVDLASRWGCSFVGMTLSESQAAIARRAIHAANLDTRVQVLVHSYDEPPAGPFDAVLAVESLAHSPDPPASVAAWRRVLAPHGLVAIVDDMPEPAAQGSDDFAAFTAGWRCPSIVTRDRLVAHLQDLGLRLIIDRDLTAECRPRSFAQIARLDWLNRVVRHSIPVPAFRQVMDSHHGGLALERLLRKGLVRYRLIVARE